MKLLFDCGRERRGEEGGEKEEGKREEEKDKKGGHKGRGGVAAERERKKEEQWESGKEIDIRGTKTKKTSLVGLRSKCKWKVLGFFFKTIYFLSFSLSLKLTYRFSTQHTHCSHQAPWGGLIG